jgi:electron transport complex protein RnfC
VGQLIAKASGPVSANIHSSVSGLVTAIEPAPYSSGVDVLSIRIQNDHHYIKAPMATHTRPIKETPKEFLLQRIEDAGIVGLGGEMYPTHLKLRPQKPISTLVINGAECEPYLSSDHRVMVEMTKAIYTGIEVAMRILEPQTVIIGIEDHMIDAMITMRNYALKYKNVKVVPLPSSYPQGSERVLIRELTQKRIRQYPLEAEGVVLNVSTCAAIGQAVVNGTPLISRIITVSGTIPEKSYNYRVRIGTPIKTLLPELSPDRAHKLGDVRVIMGGPMMGLTQHSLEVPVIKGTTGVLVLEHSSYEEQQCIHCGRCIDVCPVFIMPVMAADQGIQASECMECGLCSYYCPSRIPLVEKIRLRKLQ